jgi:hypothetical protein
MNWKDVLKIGNWSTLQKQVFQKSETEQLTRITGNHA